MTEVSKHIIDQFSAIAYERHAGTQPGVVFLCGHGSDMNGSKATHIRAWAKRRGQSFLRFDYSGHGQSDGDFLQTNISDWTRDTINMIDAHTDGPQIVVGSSLGGWIMLNLALARTTRIAALVGIAAAPDFTEDLIWDPLDEAAKADFRASGQISFENPYADYPVVYPYHLIEDGRQHLRLQAPLPITVPVRLLHGMQDAEVPWQTATRLADQLQSDDVAVLLDKTATHRFSEPRQLAQLERVLDELVSLIANTSPGI
ncbi:MAG: alpha/beta hydrolase [Pseudomonadota bacterium]|nr:alpha/beta hydrolase [Pseudomonadota bacterium]